jgi:hypothetical protein
MKIPRKTCLTALRRTLGPDGSCVRRHGDGVCLYDHPVPVDPLTPDQRAVRHAVKTCAVAWRAFAPAQREQWDTAAHRLRPAFPRQGGLLGGYQLFLHCGLNCLVAGEALPERPPVRRRPAVPQRVELLPETDAGRLRFVIRHDVPDAECKLYRVLVQATPATVRNSRAPETRTRRLICDYGPASAPPLPPSGQTLEFTAPRFPVPPARRFGVWLRIIHLPDGLDSGDVFLDLVRPGGG